MCMEMKVGLLKRTVDEQQRGKSVLEEEEEEEEVKEVPATVLPTTLLHPQGQTTTVLQGPHATAASHELL